MTKYRIVENELGEFQLQAHVPGWFPWSKGEWDAVNITRRWVAEYWGTLSDCLLRKTYLEDAPKRKTAAAEQKRKENTIKRVVE